jgi:hypothetical protein
VGYRENLYDLVLVLHIVAVVVGFGTVALNGVYGIAAKNARGIGAVAISKANYQATTIAEKAIYAVPVLGILLVVLSDGAIKFSETWVWLALVLYAIGIGLSHAILIPADKRAIALMEELAAAPVGVGAGAGGGPGAGGPPPQAIELEALGQRMAITGTVLNLLVVAVVVLMVFKPGGHVL